MPLGTQTLGGELSEGDNLGGTAGAQAQLSGALVSTSSLSATLANASVLRGNILTPGNAPPAPPRDFLGLSDTPDSYAGQAGKVVTVNQAEDGLDFETVSAGSGGDLSYTHNQLSAATTWAITHSLGKFPNVSVVDSAGTVVMGDVTYTDANSLMVHFTAGFAGKAYLN